MGKYIIINGELYHHGVKGMKWGVRRDRSRAQKDARKLADEATAYYDRINKFNALVDTRATINREESEREVASLDRKIQKLVGKLQKKYKSVEVIPTFEENGYVVKGVEALVTKLDRRGRVSSISKSFSPVETYNSWRAEANPKRLKALNAVDSKYSKKLQSAKTEDEKKIIELDWQDAIDEVESRY